MMLTLLIICIAIVLGSHYLPEKKPPTTGSVLFQWNDLRENGIDRYYRNLAELKAQIRQHGWLTSIVYLGELDPETAWWVRQYHLINKEHVRHAQGLRITGPRKPLKIVRSNENIH